MIHKAMGTEEGGTVRVSVSWFTEEKDIKEFLGAAKEIAASVARNILAGKLQSKFIRMYYEERSQESVI